MKRGRFNRNLHRHHHHRHHPLFDEKNKLDRERMICVLTSSSSSLAADGLATVLVYKFQQLFNKPLFNNTYLFCRRSWFSPFFRWWRTIFFLVIIIIVVVIIILKRESQLLSNQDYDQTYGIVVIFLNSCWFSC